MLILLSLEIVKIQNLFINQPDIYNVVTGNLKIISDSRIRKIVSKGPKYRFDSHPTSISINVERRLHLH